MTWRHWHLLIWAVFLTACAADPELDWLPKPRNTRAEMGLLGPVARLREKYWEPEGNVDLDSLLQQNPLDEREWRFDSLGKLLSETHWHLGRRISLTEYRYDSLHRLHQQKTTDQIGRRSLTVQTEYGERGELLEEQFFNLQGRLFRRKLHAYDSKGRRIELVHDEYGQDHIRRRFTYEFEGGKVKKTKMERNGHLEWTEWQSQDGHQQLKESANGICLELTSEANNSQGLRLVQFILFDSLGQLVMEELRIFASNGQQLSQLNLDDACKLVLAQEFTYDSLGNASQIKEQTPSGPSGLQHAFSYDSLSNWILKLSKVDGKMSVLRQREIFWE